MPSFTFVASIQAILMARLTPVFCDIELDTLNMDVSDALDQVTPRTAIILPVHYGGVPCDLGRLVPAARSRGLWVVEDAAHAFGSTYQGRPIGTHSDATCFSFDAIKNITCGEGGVVATPHAEVAARLRVGRLLGMDLDSWSRRQDFLGGALNVRAPGWRYHLPNLNAAIGLAQLDRLEEFRLRKRAIVRRYREAFQGLPGLALLRHPEGVFPFNFVIRVLDDRREALARFLKDRGIATGIHYVPNHLQPAFKRYYVPLPNTERAYREVLTLPLSTNLTDQEVDRVIGAVTDFFARQ